MDTVKRVPRRFYVSDFKEENVMSIFEGSGVALVTPFKENGEVDFDKMKELVEFHIANGTDAIIV